MMSYPSKTCQSDGLDTGEHGGMSYLPGKGPGRAGSRISISVLPIVLRIRTGKLWLSPRRNSADSMAGSHASTLVGHTCGRDLHTGIYRAATGPHKTCLYTWICFLSVWPILKSRPALLNRVKPLACTLDSVGVCHARPQGRGAD